MLCLHIQIYVFLKTQFIVLLQINVTESLCNQVISLSNTFWIAQYREQKQIYCIDRGFQCIVNVADQWRRIKTHIELASVVDIHP